MLLTPFPIRRLLFNLIAARSSPHNSFTGLDVKIFYHPPFSTQALLEWSLRFSIFGWALGWHIANYSSSASMVLKWNEAGTKAVAKATAVQPMPESRIYAMINLAMHDALNNIVPKYDTYTSISGSNSEADPDAAVAQAAHDVLLSLFPAQQAVVNLLPSNFPTKYCVANPPYT